MEIRVGQSLVSTVDTTAVIVVRTPAGPVDLTCGGAPMADKKSAPQPPPASAAGEGALLGKRYVDVSGALELLCVKGGAGPLAVGGVALETKAAKPLPASD